MPKPKEVIANFLGVNLRRDPVSLAEGELAAVFNADLHTQPGVVRLRKGRTPKYPSVLPRAIRLIGRHNARLYNAADQILYREQTPIVTGLHSQLLTTMLAYRPLNDTQNWTFIADRATMQKDDGSVVRQWGITPPAAAPLAVAGAAGSLTGTYKVQYTYCRVITGTTVAHESNPSPVSAGVALTSETLSVPVLASTDPQVTRIRLYRTVADGTTPLFDQMVTNVDATLTSSQADIALGAAVELDNNVPPTVPWVVEFQNHLFGVKDPDNPNYLWYSKRWLPESWPSDQFLIIGKPDDPLQCAVPLAGALGVFSLRTKYAVRGNIASGFVPVEAISTRGTVAPQSVLVTSRGVGFWARDGIWATNFLQGDQELTTDISPLFGKDVINDYHPVDLDQAAQFGLAEYKQRIYASYVDRAGKNLIAVLSQDTGKWYHYEQPVRTLYYDEILDALLMGGRDGMTYVLEDGTDDDGDTISLAVTCATRSGGDRFLRKHFEYVRIDATVYTTATATIFVDDVAVLTLTLAGTRTKVQSRLPHNTQGFTWRVQVTGELDLYAVMMLFAPLGDGS